VGWASVVAAVLVVAVALVALAIVTHTLLSLIRSLNPLSMHSVYALIIYSGAFILIIIFTLVALAIIEAVEEWASKR